jgi:hypothetical protein
MPPWLPQVLLPQQPYVTRHLVGVPLLVGSSNTPPKPHGPLTTLPPSASRHPIAPRAASPASVFRLYDAAPAPCQVLDP